MLAVVALWATLHGPAAPCQMPVVHTPAQVRRVIACAVARWPVPGGVRKAVAVAECESSLRPHAEFKGHLGIYQHAERYWAARWLRWGRPWGLPRNPYNAHTNILVSIQMVHEGGWAAWSCA